MNKHEYNIYPKMQPDEYNTIKNNIQTNGYDSQFPIILFEGDIIDGWNRQLICDELGITPTYIHFSGTSQQALEYVIKSNERRNLTSIQKACITVELIPLIEKLKSEAKANQIRKPLDSVVQKIVLQKKHGNDTNTKLAKLNGTNRTYIAKAKKIKNDDPELFEKFKAGEVTIGKTNISQLFTGENEWYTPKEYINKARLVMGSIDIDPCSNVEANEVIQAKTYYTIETNGLEQDWKGNVFMNPPFSSKEINAFIDKLYTEYELGHIQQAIILTNNNTDTRWFFKLFEMSTLMCFTKGRIKFYNKDKISAPTQGQVFFYIGMNKDNFIQQFQSVGLIMKRYDQ